MSTFFMFGKYSPEAVATISAGRTQKAVALIKGFGGEVKSMYVLLGEHDLVLIVSFPGVKEAMKASIALTRMSGIAFATTEAMSVEDFDKLTAEL